MLRLTHTIGRYTVFSQGFKSLGNALEAYREYLNNQFTHGKLSLTAGREVINQFKFLEG